MNIHIISTFSFCDVLPHIFLILNELVIKTELLIERTNEIYKHIDFFIISIIVILCMMIYASPKDIIIIIQY